MAVVTVSLVGPRLNRGEIDEVAERNVDVGQVRPPQRPEGFGDLQAWIASMRDLDHCCCPPQLFWSS